MVQYVSHLPEFSLNNLSSAQIWGILQHDCHLCFPSWATRSKAMCSWQDFSLLSKVAIFLPSLFYRETTMIYFQRDFSWWYNRSNQFCPVKLVITAVFKRHLINLAPGIMCTQLHSTGRNVWWWNEAALTERVVHHCGDHVQCRLSHLCHPASYETTRFQLTHYRKKMSVRKVHF